MSSLLQDLTYFIARIGTELKDLEDFKAKTENKIALAVLRGRIMQTGYLLAKLKSIYKKEEKRQAKLQKFDHSKMRKDKKPKPQKLTRALVDKFKYL